MCGSVEAKPVMTVAKPVMTAGDVARVCRLGREPADPTTRTRNAIMANLTKNSRSLQSYLFVSRFSGRCLAEAIVRSGGECACDLVQDPKDHFFSSSFRPQRVHRNMVAAMTRQSFLSRETLCQRPKLSLNPSEVALKDSAGRWLGKRDIVQRLN